MKRIILAAGLFLGAVLLVSSVYTLSETEQAVLTQFGRPVGGVVKDPGLHLKVPFIQEVHRFDRRWLEYDGDPNEIPTKDKKYIWVDTYARWRISDPLRFFQAVRDERGGQSRLDDIVDGETRNAIASFDLIEVVRSTNRPFQVTEDLEGIGAAEAMAKVSAGRSGIAKIILEKASKITPEFGIELVDVRFKRINYVDSVQQKVFERMISERKRIAERSRSEGQGRAAEIRGQKERDVLGASSSGYKTAQEVKGIADAKATSVYAKAYGRDADLYQFLKSMETLGGSVDEKTWLILSTNSELLKYLKSDGGPT
ncbi:MAG TPA: protease modulator HflC [Thermoanaerobaculia bacterium]|nr:protease modulator HflC [Thermoanaerobaculia bacterium]